MDYTPECIRLTTSPMLLAEELAESCYAFMFSGCASLTKVFALPAEKLAEDCYLGMFDNCISLEVAPVLPAPTLADYCYSYMFYNCSKLSSVTMLATDISVTNSMRNWLFNVASTGPFTKSASATWNETDIIPTGWTVVSQ